MNNKPTSKAGKIDQYRLNRCPAISPKEKPGQRQDARRSAPSQQRKPALTVSTGRGQAPEARKAVLPNRAHARSKDARIRQRPGQNDGNQSQQQRNSRSSGRLGSSVLTENTLLSGPDSSLGQDDLLDLAESFTRATQDRRKAMINEVERGESHFQAVFIAEIHLNFFTELPTPYPRKSLTQNIVSLYNERVAPQYPRLEYKQPAYHDDEDHDEGDGDGANFGLLPPGAMKWFVTYGNTPPLLGKSLSRDAWSEEDRYGGNTQITTTEPLAWLWQSCYTARSNESAPKRASELLRNEVCRGAMPDPGFPS